jgi:hypothetical protein
MNGIVLSSAYLLTFRLFKFKNAADAGIAFFLLYLSQIILTELMLGIEMRLFLLKLLILNAAILFAVWIITRKRPLNIVTGEETFGLLKSDKAALLAFSVLMGFAIVKIVINLVNPPFGWDSLNYHFTYPVEWLKNGNLNMPITINDDPSPPFYPINGSLFFFWLTLPLKDVFLADLGQLPFFIAAFLLVYQISRKLGTGQRGALLAACLFLLIPNFFKQLRVAYVDVMVAALFLAGVNFLILLKEEFSLSNLVGFALSVGLMIGTKTLALPYSVLLLAPFIYLACRKKVGLRLFCLGLALIAGFGGFSYLRCFIRIGNPFYPLDFKLFGMTIFKGVMDAASYAAHFEAKDYSLAKILFHEGLGAQTLLFILPAVFLALPVALFKRQARRDILTLYLFVLPLFLFLLWRFVLPMANTRYLYPALGIGMAVVFYLAGPLKIPAKIIKVIVVICVIASLAELARKQELIVSLILSAALFFLLPSILVRLKEIFRRHSVLFLALFLAFFALACLNQDYQKNEFRRYGQMVEYSGFWLEATEAWEWLNSRTTGNNIAYVGRPVPFPLYGTDFKNNVYYVSVNKTEPAKLHYFSGSHYHWGKDFLELHRNLEEKGNYRQEANYADWLANLTRRNSDYLFIYSLHQTKEIIFPLEDGWAKENPDKFELVFSNKIVHLYKIKD